MPENVNNQTESFPQQDIERIREKAEALKKSPEFQNAAPREVVKESIKQVFLTPVAGSGAVTDHDEDQLLPDYMKTATEEVREEVERLIHIALTKGMEAGVKEARRHGSFVLDALHDALVDKIMPQLNEKI